MTNTTNVSIPLELFTFDRQDELAIFAANSIIEQQFPGQGKNNFRLYNEETDAKFDGTYNETFAIKSQNREFCAKATLRVSLIKLGAHFDGMTEKSYKKVVDQMQEFLNQFLGVINQNLTTSLNMVFRIGLPTHLTHTLNSDETLYVPGVRLIDETGTYDLNVGFVRIRGGNDIDLKDAKFSLAEDDDDIDFF